MRTISAPVLTGFASDLLTTAGVPPDESLVVATSLVGANLRGHDSHGVMRLPQYVEFIQRGEYRHGVALEVLQETPALVVCDGQWGLGQIQAHRLLDLVIPKARALGVAVGTARDCGHIGRLGEYAERAAGLGLVLMATVNNGGAAKRVAPPGGREPRLSTNPFCAAVPTSDLDAPIVVDFGTSVVAEGKVRGYYIRKHPVPEGWLLDHRGEPTTDPSVLYEPPLGMILPLGGAQSYKGFGLSMILDLWAGGLSGGPCSHAMNRRVPGNNVFFLVMDSARFAGGDYLTDQASGLAESIRTTPRTHDDEAILLPGDPERHLLKDRNARGIPLDDLHWAKLVNLAHRLHVNSTLL